MYVENVVIGKPLVKESELFSSSTEDWEQNEKPKTFWTEERFLPRVLVEIGVFPSVSEIRRNKPELVRTLDEVDFFRLKATKKRIIWIMVGEKGQD